MSLSTKKIRKHLSADALFRLVRTGMEQIAETAKIEPAITIADILMSGFAMFSLKSPSLLAFDERRATDKNLGQIYHIDKIPCDTQMRTRLDKVNPKQIAPLFKDAFRQLQNIIYFNILKFNE